MRFPLIVAAILIPLVPFAAAQAPIVIAHRGASGYLPEHTLPAYAMAYAMGADYIEPDLVMTKDKVLVCLHDIELDDTTDVEAKFPNRKRSDGHWYAADFALAEVKSLDAQERLPNRFPQESHGFEVPTFEEMIELIQGLNKAFGKNVGIYPELKQPSWHRSEGLPIEKPVLDVLTRYGYTDADSPVFVQCFEAGTLKMIRDQLGSKLNLVLLIGGGMAAQNLLNDNGLARVAEYANGIGPDKNLILKNPEIVEWAHAHHLVVHPYTFRTDMYDHRFENYEMELREYLVKFKIDGFFADQSDRGRYVVDMLEQSSASRAKKKRK